MFDGIGAELVWDGTHEVLIPERMGKPSAGRMEGTPAERLTELAGRVCYDDRTEVLSENGWVMFKDLPRSVPVATVNLLTQELEYQTPTDYIADPFDGELYAADSSKVSVRVTYNHSMVVVDKDKLVLRQAVECSGTKYKIRRSALRPNSRVVPPAIVVQPRRYTQPNPNPHSDGIVEREAPGLTIKVTKDWAKVLGYYISEGSLNIQKKSGDTVSIYQNSGGMAPIIDAIKGCGFAPTGPYDDPRKDVQQIRIGSSALVRHLVQFGKGSKVKRLPPYVFTWPSYLRETLLDALMYGDGTTSKHGVRIYNTASEGLADDVQRLIVELGRNANINFSQCETCMMYRVRETKHGDHTVNSHKVQDRSESYTGTVYCVSVPNKTLIVRRNKKVYVCGNCYDSLNSKRSRPSDEYIKHILEVGHLCYDSGTDVLTTGGWKSWPEVTQDDRLATLNQATHRVEYHKPRRLIRDHHRGRMYRVEGQQVDLLVTPNHKMWACRTTTRLGRRKESYELISASLLDVLTHAYMKGSEGYEPRESGIDCHSSISRDVLSLLGFAVGDGYLGERGRQVHFHLYKERKISWLTATASRLGFELGVNRKNGKYRVTLPGPLVELFREIYDTERQKQIPPLLLTTCSSEALNGLYEGLIASDGHDNGSSHVFDTTSQRLAGQFQQLCLHIGVAANITNVLSPEDHKGEFVLNHKAYRLGVERRTLKPEFNKPGSPSRTSWVEKWEGDVYCAEVPNNTLYVRRNGKPVWSGNSIAEHYNATILLKSNEPSFIDMLSFVMLNRPWVWVTPLSPTEVRLTMNLRVVREFDRWTKVLADIISDYPLHQASHLSVVIKNCFHDLAPRLIPEPHPAGVGVAAEQLGISSAEIVEPENDAERWISVYTWGSRGFSHELVRHGDFTGMSQRSTRYCNESKSPWTLHPLMQMFLREEAVDPIDHMIAKSETEQFIAASKALYKSWVKRLMPFIESKIDPDDPYAKTTARKQARGAARGLLGNALETELVFSASVSQWKHIFRMRAAAAADGEIRYAACKALEACKSSRYGDRFEDLSITEASDGTGFMLVDGGAA